MQREMRALIPTGDDRCYLPFTVEGLDMAVTMSPGVICPDNGEHPCTCINPKHHLRGDPAGAHGCHCGRRWADDGRQLDAPGWEKP